jgi:mannose-6-phosphate isomerase-like protein (cupin superfamily)
MSTATPLQLSRPQKLLASLSAPLLSMASATLGSLRTQTDADRVAATCRVRGSGPGASLRAMIREMERAHPLELDYPFEGSQRVGGAVWPAESVGGEEASAVAKLRWESRALDLPMHVHPYADRCIFVLEGRGFYHVSDEPVEHFSGDRVRTVAAREGDVFVFTRGVVHTFSTWSSPMTLISCQLPFIRFEDPRQYALPSVRWTAGDCLDPAGGEVVIDEAFSVLVAQPPR